MQRVLEMFLFKAWLTTAEALEYSESILNRLLLCQHIVRDIEQRLREIPTLTPEFNIPKAKSIKINDEVRWRGLAERNTSISLRIIAAVGLSAPRFSERRRGKVESHIGKISGAPSGSAKNWWPSKGVISNQITAQTGNKRSN